jgi:putative PIN family toxin of toxin-antitoxin system
VSTELIAEFQNVVSRDKIKQRLQADQVHYFHSILAEQCVAVDLESSVEVCRDPKDNFLLDLAIDGHADYLLTRDSDLLILERIDECEILTYRQFVDQLRGK